MWYRRLRSLVAAGAALVALACGDAPAARAQASPAAIPDAATDLQPSPGLALVRAVSAGGAQIYRCAATADGAFAWTLVGPKALLFNADGSDFGTHAAGPRWNAADGSGLLADGAHPLARVARAGSVAELRLRVLATTGRGVLAGVREVVRSATVGGSAPPDGCDATHADATVGVPYTATYAFYR